MRFSLLALCLVAGCSAAIHPNLRGISKDEEKQYYDLILQQQVSSLDTSAPTEPRAQTPQPSVPAVVATPSPTKRPTSSPSRAPTPGRTPEPTPGPTPSPSRAPTPGRTPEPTPGPTPEPTPGPTPSPTVRPVTPSPTAKPTRLPTEIIVPTEAPTNCFFILDNCPESCFEANESDRPLRCTDMDIQRPDCDSLPFPPLESCPLCCPEDCMLNSQDCSPTPVPTPEPSAEPSPAPSPVPTPCRDLTELCPEKCWEVEPFERLPLCVDFGRPDCDTLPFPTDSCPTCCPTQCVDAPELGDCTPTPLPTPSPSLEPTQCIPPPGCPSSCADVETPNSLCSAECIACPPVSCDIDIGIQEICPSLSCEWDVCTSPPNRLEFLFAGGPCSSSDFKRCAAGSTDACTCDRESVGSIRFPSGFSCNDFNGGPPSATQTQTRSWIEVIGGGISYFDGPVRVGTSFNITSPNNGPVSSQLLIRIFEYDVAADAPGRSLQVTSFSSNCDGGNMFLTDKFAASQLVEFQQGSTVKSLFQEISVSYALALQAESDATSLSLSTANIVLLSSGNFGRLSGPQLGNVDVSGVSIPPALEFNVLSNIVPDEDHRILASFGGVLDGRECFGIEEQLFSCTSPRSLRV